MSSIQNNKVVTLEYVLLDNKTGEVIEDSKTYGPLVYLHGAEIMPQKFEAALNGKVVGDKATIVLDPKEGYGEFDSELVADVQRDELGDVGDIEEGMEFEQEDEQGIQIWRVTDIDGDTITLNGNHPLADYEVRFEVEVKEMRDASEEELECGNALVDDEDGCGCGCDDDDCDCEDGDCGCGNHDHDHDHDKKDGGCGCGCH